MAVVSAIVLPLLAFNYGEYYAEYRRTPGSQAAPLDSRLIGKDDSGVA